MTDPPERTNSAGAPIPDAQPEIQGLPGRAPAVTRPGSPAEPIRSAPGFDPASRHGLHPQVALRPEPFGALAYHYGNRRLTFVRSQEVVDLLRDLDRYPSVTDAVIASGIEPRRHPSVLRALDQLWRSEVIRAC